MQHNQQSTLPLADPASAEHSMRVSEFVRARIAEAGGSLSFAEFMQCALYAPGLGYYVAGANKFGAEGDFVTAPEVSPVFGYVLARQCAEVLADVGGGTILEYGAGSGRLAADILGALDKHNALPARYQIVEVSPDLQQRQAEYLRTKIPDLVSRVTWLELPPAHHKGVIIANEVLDALPVERFTMRAGEIKQHRVVTRADAFAIEEGPAPDFLVDSVAALEQALGNSLPANFVSEISVGLSGWVSDLAASLQEGVAFLFDYGVTRREYYAAERSGGWLRCYFRHRAHNDPLILVGIQDITAWVDFNAVADAAVSSGLDIAGYTAQAQYLMSGGLDAEMREFESLPLESQLELSAQIKTLTLPGEMGERFKCMALRRGNVSTPSAFHMSDRTHTL
jgi:SAM-dependent MidA family methyltransferase